MRVPEHIRFWSKVGFSGGDRCWEWLGGKAKGYGTFRRTGHRGMSQAHRWAYERLRGPIPEGLELDHLCRNAACVNPAHLEPVTHKENVARGRNQHREQTHCKRGRLFSPENTQYYRGRRVCRACDRLRCRARGHPYRHRAKAKA